MNQKMTAGGAITALFVGTVGLPVMAQEPIKIRILHGYPETHFIWTDGAKKFGNQVVAETNGQVTFEVYPSD